LYFGEVSVDPKDPDTVYVPNTTTYQSHDGGKTFTRSEAPLAATTTTNSGLIPMNRGG